jgi:hypothetical protein
MNLEEIEKGTRQICEGVVTLLENLPDELRRDYGEDIDRRCPGLDLLHNFRVRRIEQSDNDYKKLVGLISDILTEYEPQFLEASGRSFL